MKVFVERSKFNFNYLFTIKHISIPDKHILYEVFFDFQNEVKVQA